MFVGIGVGIGRQRFAGGFADSYSARVLADGGTIESLSCVANASTLLQQASFLFIPSGYKAGVAYSALPNNGNGDLTWTRNSTANRTQSNGNIGSVGANVPRLSYMYGSCPSALLEPQRTNLLTYSNSFSNPIWATTNITMSDNSQLGIDGNTSASLATTTSTGNLLYQLVTVVPGTIYTFTFYVKRGTMTDMKYRVRDFTNSVDIISPTSYYSQTNSSTFTRISVTITAPALCTSIRFYPFSDTGSIGTAIITQAQVEVGSYATTIIPTTTATATRLADSFTRNNIYTNGLIGVNGGTWYVELKNNVAYARDTVQRVFGIGDSNTSINNGFVIRPNSAIAERYTIEKYISGIRTGLETTALGNAKIAIKWNGSTADVFQNGVKIVSATTFGVVNMEFINGTGVDSPKFIQQMALFNTVLSDSDCQLLTT